MKAIILALYFLAPGLGHITTERYAKIIHRESERYHVDPLLIATIIHVETAKSWKKTVRSPTHDFGLMQVHVSTTTNPGLLGREEILFDPATNIRYGTRTLAMWRAYHRRTCNKHHPFWAHYKWGYRVGEISHAIKVRRLYRVLRKWFYHDSDDVLLSRNLES